MSCKSGHTINPVTGKCIKITGPTYKKLVREGIIKEDKKRATKTLHDIFADVIIIGAGPIGLMTGIMLKKKIPSLKIHIVEMRAKFIRKQILIVDDNFYNIIPLPAKRMIWGQNKKGCFIFEPRKDRFMRCYRSKAKVLSYASVSIDILQTALYNYAKKTGITIHRPSRNKMEYIRFNPQKNMVYFKKPSEKNSTTIKYKYLIGADGKNSEVREKVLRTPYVNQRKNYDAQTGVFLLKIKNIRTYKKPSKIHHARIPQDRVRFFVTQQNDGYIGIGLSNKEFDTIVNKNIRSKSDLPLRLRRVIDQYLTLYGYDPKDVIITGGSVFEIDLYKAKNVAKKIGNGYHFIVGDAAFNIHFFSGSGLNLGISTAQSLVKNLIDFIDHRINYSRFKSNYSKDVVQYAREALKRSVSVAVPFDRYIQPCQNYSRADLIKLAKEFNLRYTNLTKNELCLQLGNKLKK